MLKFLERLVLVTAAHVFRAYEDAVRHTPSTVCQVRLLPLALSSRLIQVDHDLDIVTFDITAEEMGAIGATAIDAALQLPPLQGGRGLSLQASPSCCARCIRMAPRNLSSTAGFRRSMSSRPVRSA